MRATLIVCIAGVISGCATAPDATYYSTDDEIKSMSFGALLACRAEYADPRLDVIRGKHPGLSGIERPTRQMLMDETTSTDDQRAAILIFDIAALNCAAEWARVCEMMGPAYLAVHGQAVSQGQTGRVELYSGKITFGEFNKRMDAITQEVRAAFASIDQQRRQLAVKQTAAAAAEMNTMPKNQPLQLTFQPIVTPQTMNCTSTRIGAYTYTNCR